MLHFCVWFFCSRNPQRFFSFFLFRSFFQKKIINLHVIWIEMNNIQRFVSFYFSADFPLFGFMFFFMNKFHLIWKGQAAQIRLNYSTSTYYIVDGAQGPGTGPWLSTSDKPPTAAVLIGRDFRPESDRPPEVNRPPIYPQMLELCRVVGRLFSRWCYTKNPTKCSDKKERYFL